MTQVSLSMTQVSLRSPSDAGLPSTDTRHEVSLQGDEVSLQGDHVSLSKAARGRPASKNHLKIIGRPASEGDLVTPTAEEGDLGTASCRGALYV